MIPTLIFLGVLYASVSARFIFFRIFEGSRHKNDHTVVGWGTWTLILRKSPDGKLAAAIMHALQARLGAA